MEKYVLDMVKTRTYDGETDQDIIVWLIGFLPPQVTPPPREPPPDRKMDIGNNYAERTPTPQDRGIQFTAINRPPPPPPLSGVIANTPGMRQPPVSNGVVPMDEDTVVPTTVVAGGLQSSSRERSRDNRSASPSRSPRVYRQRSPLR